MRACWHWTRSTRCRTGKTGSRASWMVSQRNRPCWSRAARAWKPGAKAAIRWLAVTWLSACTRSRCGNGGTSRAVQRRRPSRASWNGAAFPNPAWPTRPRMPIVGGGSISPISSARTFWSFPAFRRSIPCGSSSNCCAKGLVRPCPWPPLPATWPCRPPPSSAISTSSRPSISSSPCRPGTATWRGPFCKHPRSISSTRDWCGATRGFDWKMPSPPCS